MPVVKLPAVKAGHKHAPTVSVKHAPGQLGVFLCSCKRRIRLKNGKWVITW